jgi:hypothetical protein
VASRSDNDPPSFEGVRSVAAEPTWEVKLQAKGLKQAPPTSICALTVADPLSGQETPVDLAQLKASKEDVLKRSAEAFKTDKFALRFVLRPVTLPKEGRPLPRLVTLGVVVGALLAIGGAAAFAVYTHANAPKAPRFVVSDEVVCPVVTDAVQAVSIEPEHMTDLGNALFAKTPVAADVTAAVCKSALRDALASSFPCTP